MDFFNRLKITFSSSWTEFIWLNFICAAAHMKLNFIRLKDLSWVPKATVFSKKGKFCHQKLQEGFVNRSIQIETLFIANCGQFQYVQ